MKKSLQNLFLLSGVLVSSALISQPIMTATGINPVVGDNFAISTTNYVSPGTAGASQTWNLSSMTSASTATNSIVNPSATTNGSSYPNANIAITGNATGYFKTSSTAFQNHGSVASGIVIVYSNPEDLLHFPFSYTNTYSDNFAATFTSSGFTFYRSGTCTVTADGYGTLTTPAGTYNNVTRVHLIENYKDSANLGFSTLINNYQNDEYLWYTDNTRYALATVFSFTTTPSTGSPTTTQSGSYLNNPVGIFTHSDPLSSYKLFPNPAVNNVSLSVSLTKNQKVDIKLFNSIGSQVTSLYSEGIQGTNEYSLNVSDLPNGVYFAQISLDGTLSSTRRFVISK